MVFLPRRRIVDSVESEEATTIFEGTSEIQRLVISRALTGLPIL
jgi:alkylation response protein AidB-like acyl-CoA dehydrogenase